MGLRAREYARGYDWNLIAKNTSDLYYWTIKGGNKPNFVYIVWDYCKWLKQDNGNFRI